MRRLKQPQRVSVRLRRVNTRQCFLDLVRKTKLFSSSDICCCSDGNWTLKPISPPVNHPFTPFGALSAVTGPSYGGKVFHLAPGGLRYNSVLTVNKSADSACSEWSHPNLSDLNLWPLHKPIFPERVSTASRVLIASFWRRSGLMTRLQPLLKTSNLRSGPHLPLYSLLRDFTSSGTEDVLIEGRLQCKYSPQCTPANLVAD